MLRLEDKIDCWEFHRILEYIISNVNIVRKRQVLEQQFRKWHHFTVNSLQNQEKDNTWYNMIYSNSVQESIKDNI